MPHRDNANRPIFTACLGTETNSFAPIPTGLAAFEEMGMCRRDGSLTNPDGIGGFLKPFRLLAEADGRPVIESVCAFAQPGGTTVQSVYEMLRDRILDDLRDAGPIAFVLLGLHGAMIADGYDDCEGDLISRVRAIVGPTIPIGVELDPHCHLTERMVANADAIVIMKQYPHTDWGDRAGELYRICAGLAQGRLHPVSALFDCRMVGFYPTTIGPMAALVRELHAAEAEDGILSVSLAHGFPWGDQPEAGTRVLVIADGGIERARTVAERLGRNIYAQRNALLPDLPTIAQALEACRHEPGRVVLADTADNAGAGAPGDTTHLLRGMLGAAIGPSVFGTIFDPGAVRVCEEAGIGARVMLRLGGKLGVSSGDPFDVEVEIKALSPHHTQTAIGTTQLGASAWVRIGEVDVVIASIRAQVFGPSAFTNLGITLEDKRIIALKSMEHFRAAFEPLADRIIPVATPGAIQMDFATLPYRHKRDLDYFPRTSDPLGLDSTV